MIARKQVGFAARGAMLPEEGQILTGPQFSEPVRVETVKGDGPGGWVLGVVGIKTGDTTGQLR